MKLKLNFTHTEPFIFVLVLLCSLYPSLSNTFNPTLDGGTHLYNSKLLNYFFTNPMVERFYDLSNTPSPNLFSNAFLAFFNLFFKAEYSEKLFIIFYYVSFPLGLRYFIKAYNKQHLFLSIIGIPLSHSFLFYLGFYNFCISFSFLFIALGFYYIRFYRQEQVALKHYLLLFLLIVLTYFSGVLSYVYLMVILLMYELSTLLFLRRQGLKAQLKSRCIKNILTALPCMLFLFVFYKNISFPHNSDSIPLKELVKNLLNLKPLIVYDYNTDVFYTRCFSILIALLCFWILIKNLSAFKQFITQYFASNLYLIIALGSLLLYFVIPDGASAGMMSDRFCYLFLIFLTLWIVSAKTVSFSPLLTLCIVIPHFYLLKIHSAIQKDHNQVAVNIMKSEMYIKENSTVLPVNLQQNWIFMMRFFPNYLGLHKPMIILETGEATLPWFPLNWDLKGIPKLTLNGRESIEHTNWPKKEGTGAAKEIDYVYLLGSLTEIETNPYWQELKTNLDSAYLLFHRDPKNNIYIYKHQ